MALIAGIQRGVAAKLDFQAIVDLVGDKLRAVFDTGMDDYMTEPIRVDPLVAALLGTVPQAVR